MLVSESSSNNVLPSNNERSNIEKNNATDISEWRHCVKNLSVSSHESQANRLIDENNGYWQSSGLQGKVHKN